MHISGVSTHLPSLFAQVRPVIVSTNKTPVFQLYIYINIQAGLPSIFYKLYYLCTVTSDSKNGTRIKRVPNYYASAFFIFYLHFYDANLNENMYNCLSLQWKLSGIIYILIKSLNSVFKNGVLHY